MTTELNWLTLTALMTALLWVPYVLNRMTLQGVFGSMGNLSPDEPTPAAWARRAKSAHVVAVENLPIFSTLVLVANAIGVSNPVTTGACAVYFFGMLAHYVVFTLGIPYARTLAYLVAGLGAELTLALSILRVF